MAITSTAYVYMTDLLHSNSRFEHGLGVVAVDISLSWYQDLERQHNAAMKWSPGHEGIKEMSTLTGKPMPISGGRRYDLDYFLGMRNFGPA